MNSVTCKDALSILSLFYMRYDGIWLVLKLSYECLKKDTPVRKQLSPVLPP